MDTEVTVRPATLADASALAVLVDIAADGLAVQMWRTLAAPGQSPVGVGRARARREEGGFSYRNTFVAETNGEIAASLVGYRLDDPYVLTGLGEMPEFVQPLVRLEARAPGSWYINVVATFPEFRGRGIGAKLLDLADGIGRKSGAPGMSVIVGSWNGGAARLYRRTGYTPAASERAVLPPDFAHRGDWILMTKPLQRT
jgi:ribosomal protein S18 acetylase RimI-like enzyme